MRIETSSDNFVQYFKSHEVNKKNHESLNFLEVWNSNFFLTVSK